MSNKMDRAKEAVMEFFKTANPQDEFFMITFNDEPERSADFTNSVEDIQNSLVFAVPESALPCSTPSTWASARCGMPSMRRRRC